jgi:hypothetical protein
VYNPEDFEPDLDDLSRGELHELGMPGVVSDVLDDWLHDHHGVTSSHHGVGAFLEALAAEGYRVEKIEVPSFVDLLPASNV